MGERGPLTRRRAAIAMLAPLLAACGVRLRAPQPTRAIPTLIPTAAAPEPTAAPPGAAAAEGPADSGWAAGEGGVELRRVRAQIAEGRPPAPITVARLDPRQTELRVAYDPEHPRTLRGWFASAQPTLAVNGGYFTKTNEAAGLVISEGVASGASYEGFGGMLAAHPDGAIEIRPLRDAPYDPAEPLLQATQSSPMLVFPGGQPADFTDDGSRARRSAVAIDGDGRLLVVVCPTSALTLRELSRWLAEGDMGVDRALNLDGGPSTGIFLASGGLSEQIDSFTPLPIVIFARSRKTP